MEDVELSVAWPLPSDDHRSFSKLGADRCEHFAIGTVKVHSGVKRNLVPSPFPFSSRSLDFVFPVKG